jgi:hypothetical protein
LERVRWATGHRPPAFSITGAARALAIECIHAASLIHDDVVDGDVLRRERAATGLELATEAEALAQLPLIAPLLAHFCADVFPDVAGLRDGRPGGICDEWMVVRPLLRERMRQVIDARLRQAQALAGRLRRRRSRA